MFSSQYHNLHLNQAVSQYSYKSVCVSRLTCPSTCAILFQLNATRHLQIKKTVLEQYSIIDFSCKAAGGVTPLLYRQVEQVAGRCQRGQTSQKHRFAAPHGRRGAVWGRYAMQMSCVSRGGRGVEEEERFSQGGESKWKFLSSSSLSNDIHHSLNFGVSM